MQDFYEEKGTGRGEGHRIEEPGHLGGYPTPSVQKLGRFQVLLGGSKMFLPSLKDLFTHFLPLSFGLVLRR